MQRNNPNLYQQDSKQQQTQVFMTREQQQHHQISQQRISRTEEHHTVSRQSTQQIGQFGKMEIIPCMTAVFRQFSYDVFCAVFEFCAKRKTVQNYYWAFSVKIFVKK